LLVLRNNTERPEAVECGVAVLVGDQPGRLEQLLHAALHDSDWANRVRSVKNPFGDGTAGEQIADLVQAHFRGLATTPVKVAR
jgi:UDP-N-acetylglucosamine 2-epimerase (non-hydrolysing)